MPELFAEAQAQAQSPGGSAGAKEKIQLNGDSEVLYDARSTTFDRSNQRYIFDGDVVLIGGGYLITADKVDVAYASKTLTASGHVLFMYQNQIFTGDSIHLQWESGDFSIENAVLVSNDARESTEASRRVLGQSIEEISYEAARKSRLKEIEDGKAGLKDDFQKEAATEPSDELVESYARLLEKQQLVEKSKVPSQAERDPERRRRYERRRAYWEKARTEAAQASGPKTYYFRIEGEEIQRTDGFLYRAKNATFTPCICDEDETPPWSFQAQSIEAMSEGYVDLKHPILKVKGLPILYLPYLKMPLKGKRQSGFLTPQVQTGDRKNGFAYTQPVYLDFAPNADATVTTDVFQKRGTRVGVEARYVARRYSGLRYQVEMIRDSSWLDASAERAELLNYHLNENPYCASRADPVDRTFCEQTEVRDHLSFPSNTQRGKQEWDGRYFLAPRLSLVTKGKVVSDHRYLEDLYLPSDVITAFGRASEATQYLTSKARINFDGKDFFAGLETDYGDGVREPQRYSGQQMPANFHLQTRYFRLFPSRWISLPSYAEIDARAISIQQAQPDSQDLGRTNDVTLGNGNWQRYAMQVNTPLISDSIIRLDHFIEGEVRSVEHISPGQLESAKSLTRSWRTGLNFNLPVDGTGRLPRFLETEGGETYVRHIMNWSLGISTRPTVIRDGKYGEANQQGAPLVYFPSDRNAIYQEDRDVADEDIMVPHQRVTLKSSHRWQVFDRVTEAVPAKSQTDLRKDALLDLREEARRELMTVKEQRVRSPGAMLRETGPGSIDWYIPRYRTVDTHLVEPVTFNTTISYDYQQEKLRREQLEANAQLEQEAQSTQDPGKADSLRRKKLGYFDLAEPWIGPFSSVGLNWQGFSLTTAINYNLYEKTSTSLSFTLGLPAFYKNSLSLSYVVDKTPEEEPITKAVLYRRTKTLVTGWSTRLIPRVTLGYNFIRKEFAADKGPNGVAEKVKTQYGTSSQLSYDDPSTCWGIQLVREKDMNQFERRANWYLQLAVLLGDKRLSADISPAIERDLGLESSQP